MKAIDRNDEAYQEYVAKGRMSRTKLNLLCGIGFFIFGWLLAFAYAKLGRFGQGMAVMVATINCTILANHFGDIFLLVALLVYTGGWVRANKILTRYQELDREAAHETETCPDDGAEAMRGGCPCMSEAK